MTDTDTYYERLDISEALESADWIADDENPLDILRKNGATFAILNSCGDTGVSKDGWTIEFPSDVPAVVVIAACLAAAGESFIPLATATQLLATEEPTA